MNIEQKTLLYIVNKPWFVHVLETCWKCLCSQLHACPAFSGNSDFVAADSGVEFHI